MKINNYTPTIETSGNMEAHLFSIGDASIIFDILRSKMYSNPILAVCREISCNARDAHREVGTQDKPIHINLPSALEPFYKIKDFGPGISPDRIENIFVRYGVSTKREDNLQTGAFGMGSKTPFAVTDTFTITTVYNNFKYSYACYIDETKVGKLSLLSKSNTDESNGTEISIPIKASDFNLFRQYTEQACRHWTVKPTIIGPAIEWQVIDPIIEGKGWAINSSNDSYNNRSVKLIIDGIEYPVDLEALRKYADLNLVDSAKGNVIMYFNNGELSLSASREQIFLDKFTQDKIATRLAEITKEIKIKVDTKIDSFNNLWDANVYYQKELKLAFSNLNFLGKLLWKDCSLNYGYGDDVGCPVYTFTRGFYSRKLGNEPNKLTRTFGKYLEFTEGSKLYINDLPIKEPTPRNLKKAFEDDPALNHVQVICPTDKITIDVLNKKFNLDKMEPAKLSNITKASSRLYTAPSSRLLIFKFDSVVGTFRQVSYESMDTDENDKVICFLMKDTYPANSRIPLLGNKKDFSLHNVAAMKSKYPKTSFYGVDIDTDKLRVKEEFSEFKSIDNFIEENVLNNKLMNYIEIKFAKSYRHNVNGYMLSNSGKLESLLNKSSLYLEKINLHKKIQKLSGSESGLLDIYESVKGKISDAELTKFAKDNPSWDISLINEKCNKKYPLLESINNYSFSSYVAHIAQYINLIDKS